MYELFVKRAEELRNDPVEFSGGFHGFAVNQPRVVWMRCQEIEVGDDEFAQFYAWRGVFFRRFVDPDAKLPEKILEHGAMQAALVSEIVVQHGFIRMRSRCNFFGARAGHALRGEVLLRGGENSAGRSRVLDFFSAATHCFS